jgi:hypothetical protein
MTRQVYPIYFPPDERIANPLHPKMGGAGDPSYFDNRSILIEIEKGKKQADRS